MGVMVTTTTTPLSMQKANVRLSKIINMKIFYKCSIVIMKKHTHTLIWIVSVLRPRC